MMKNLLFTFMLVFGIVTIGNSQFEISNLYGGVNVGYAVPAGSYKDVADGGLTYNVVLGYKLNENLGVGLELGNALTLALTPDGSAGILGAEIYGLSNYLARADYRFLTGNFKPYAAVGLGLASVEEPTIADANGNEVGEKRFGLGANLELGINLYGVVVSYSYVVNGKTPKEPFFNTDHPNVWATYHRIQVGYNYNF